MSVRMRWILPALAAALVLSAAPSARAQEPWCWSLRAETVDDHLEIQVGIGPDLQSDPEVVGFRLLRQTLEACGSLPAVAVGDGPIPLGGGVVVDAEVQEGLSYRYELMAVGQDGSLSPVWPLCGVDTFTWSVPDPVLYTSLRGGVWLGTGRVEAVDGGYEAVFCSVSCEDLLCMPLDGALPPYVEKPGGGFWTPEEMAASGFTFRFHGSVGFWRSWEFPDCATAIGRAEIGGLCPVPAAGLSWGALRARY